MITVYAIYHDETCLYVGVTTRPFEKRQHEHDKALREGKHSNKSLQKYVDKVGSAGYDSIQYRVVASYNVDNSLVKYFAEALWNSVLKPKFAKVVIQQGRSRVVLQRCDAELADKILQCIESYRIV